jgi:hypothetical protein
MTLRIVSSIEAVASTEQNAPIRSANLFYLNLFYLGIVMRYQRVSRPRPVDGGILSRSSSVVHATAARILKGHAITVRTFASAEGALRKTAASDR